MALESYNTFLRLLLEIKTSPQYDILFPGRAGKDLIRYRKALSKFLDDVNVRLKFNLSLFDVYPMPYRKLFRKSEIKKVIQLFKDMESYAKDYGRDNPEKAAFLGMIIIFYIVTMKNLYVLGVFPYMDQRSPYKDNTSPVDFSYYGVSKSTLKKIRPIMIYINKSVDELVASEVSKADINYFMTVFKRMVAAEV